MKKILPAIFLLLFGMCSTAWAAPSINYGYALMPDGNSFTSPYSNVTVETFNSIAANVGLMPTGYSGNGSVVSGSTGTHAAPYGLNGPDLTNYLAVPYSGSSLKSVTINFNTAYNYLGLWWGSVDGYNAIFFNNGSQVASYGGSDVAPPANGDQGNHLTNLYVNFLDLPSFNQVVLQSTSYALEIDNLAVGINPNHPVPEPSTLLLFGAGLAGISVYKLRKKN